MTEPLPAEPWLPLALDLPAEADGARRAAARYVRRMRPELFAAGATPTAEAHADVVYGAQLLTARLWARRSSPTGLASFGEFGPGAVLRVDPDIDRLLGIGRNTRAVVG